MHHIARFLPVQQGMAHQMDIGHLDHPVDPGFQVLQEEAAFCFCKSLGIFRQVHGPEQLPDEVRSIPLVPEKMMGTVKSPDPQDQAGILSGFCQIFLYGPAESLGQVFRAQKEQGLEQDHLLFRSRRRHLVPLCQYFQIRRRRILFLRNVGLGRPQPLIPGGQHRPDKGTQAGADPVLMLLGITPLRIDDLFQVLPEQDPVGDLLPGQQHAFGKFLGVPFIEIGHDFPHQGLRCKP